MMHRMILLVVGFLSLVGVGSAQIVQNGQCSTINLMENFVLDSFIGQWYEIGKSSTQNADCSNLQFSTTTDGISVSNPSVVNNFLQTSTGTATHTTDTARLTLSLSGSTSPIDFWVLGSDYSNYTIAINCVDLDTTQRQLTVWQLGRSVTSYATEATLTAANTSLSTISLSVSDLTAIDHSTAACTQLPVIGDGQPVILDGQCNTASIAVVQNFDVARFTGTWHEISSYYSANALGTCARADYTLVESTVNVVNSQVFNQQLFTISGTADLIGTDQSGRLNVTLDVAGTLVTQELLILNTNYDDWAVSYSCQDMPDNQRQVNAWILSRNKQLSAASQTAIDSVIASLVDLNNNYFQNTDQSDSACFYYPAYQEGVAVMFPGTCDNSIAAVPNFNLAQFTGTWHEIEAYPKEQQTGTCVNHAFSTGTGNSLNLVSNQVVSQEATSASGSVTLVSSDGSGRLSLTITVGGQLLEFSYWILDTDYTSYALAYSCVQVDTDKRAVYSWKLSRQQTMAAAGSTAINTAMAAVDVLDQRYFENVDQTDSGCFYFPDAQDGTPVMFPGPCDPTIPVQANFDPTRYMGLWHDVSSYPSTFQTGSCNTAYYTLVGNTVDVFNTQVINQQLDTINGSAIIPNPDEPAKLLVSFPIAGTDQTTSTDYWVLATDYTTYSLVYSCVNVPTTNQRVVFSWKLGREKTLPAAAIAEIDAVTAPIQVLDDRYYVNQDQSEAGCFYFPDAQDGTPVTFPGPCDPTIPVQANFDPARYMGLWHDVSSYPSTFQTGSCNTAYYTLVGNTVDVFNTQVINQQLDTINGSAIIPNPNEPAKLLVSFPIAGTDQTTSTDYWVLATDYTTYSLVYSCVNVPTTNQRVVFSWKLGREKTLPAAAIAEIDAVTTPIQVLDDRYYVNQDQSEAGCFYYPEATGERVIFPGVCDNNIAAVPNFNLAQFTGTWHEVQAYPKEQQTGSCVNHVFSIGIGNSMNLVSSQVVNQTETTASGSVTLASADGSGRLTLSLNTETQVIQYPFWILATDYTSYALAYSCVQVDTDQRAVYSSKLSRQQTMAAAGSTAINTAMAAVDVLDQRYFDNVDQSDAGCFYFPDTQDGTPVTFPGPCDPTIPVQANFDPARYMGLWHDVSSYPSTFQTGSCNTAYYTLVGNTVDVFNTQVINQQLDTINGSAIIPNPNEPAKLLVSFPIAGTDQTTSTDYWVLATDYTTYSLVYSCVNVPTTNQRVVFSWKLGREKTLPAAAIAEIDAVTAPIQVLDDRYYVNKDQSAAGCFYYPEATGERVIFPGVCDNNIAAVPNFNLAQFTGTWHEVQAYPKEQQTGTCVNHVFSTGTGNSLNLVSNQVVNLEATSANGSVTLVSSDGSGRLSLAMTVGGQLIEIPYWVLDTDYIGYALVYACVQQSPDSRAVYSWKLSRQQTLTAAADTAIDTAMAPVQVLEQQYFENIGQSEAACFSYPDIPAGNPIILQGLCESVTPVANFQSSQFTGTWHEIARFASARQSGDCAANEFTSTGQNTFSLTQTIVYNERLTRVSGTATLAADGSGTLTATLSDGAGLTYTTTLYILDTDYTEFALLYGCENVQNTNTRQIYSWKLSRSQFGFTQAANDRISQVVTNTVGLLERYYQSTGQTNADCFYYPDLGETPEAIVIPGPCAAVSAMPNFNPTSYLGDWYDVTRYPIASQFGTCPRAHYSLVDGVITIRNTMVVNETQRVQHGIARLSTAGTGLLQVTVVLENGEESVLPYLILGTDYTSYSLVYACRNLADGSRQVYSWKFSRTPTLTADANTAINNIISSTQGLLEDYYQTQSHTDQDCFYVPELVPGQSVLFPGSCEQVTGMQGFNPSQYLGWWHEFERYPSDDYRGQCTSANFIQVGNAINVVETGVYDGVANETTRLATISADGVISISNDGINTRWIVIGTDYNTYSLLYSCEDVTTTTGTYRRVWSAKHTKQASLSDAAKSAMEPLIAANAVLHEHLYEVVNQSSSACFHHREDSGEQVTLRGQCDNNIPVQANFDLSQFIGTWYQIERYPYPQVSNDATCVGTRLIVDGETVSVQNWEVLDGTLNVKEGTATVNGATLSITLPVEGSEETVTTDLHILTTDYENYALAFTCTNINSFQRTVGAFKLSRSRGLSNEAQFAIGTYMATREELHQPYFISVAHNEDCQEPSSALLVKSSIIIMLVSVVLHLVM